MRSPDQKGFYIRMLEKGLAAELCSNLEIIFDLNGRIFRLTAQLPESDD